MAKTFQDKLCEIFVTQKVMNQAMVEKINNDFKSSSKVSFEEFLITEKIITKKNLLAALATYYGVPSFDVLSDSFDKDLLMEFPQDVLVRYRFVPLKRENDALIIVASQPNNQELLPELAEYVSDEIQLYVGIRSDIIDVIMEHYQDSLGDGSYQDEDESDDLFQDEEDLFNHGTDGLDEQDENYE
ncbi:hypothetical protein EBU95_17175 [bacterium]|jgi:hypothetical protein|nr:hypothetical protein [bacterium]